MSHIQLGTASRMPTIVSSISSKACSHNPKAQTLEALTVLEDV